MLKSFIFRKEYYDDMLSLVKDEEVKQYLEKGARGKVRNFYKRIIVYIIYTLLFIPYNMLAHSFYFTANIQTYRVEFNLLWFIISSIFYVFIVCLCHMGYWEAYRGSIDNAYLSEYEVDCINGYFGNIVENVLGDYSVCEKNGNHYYKNESGQMVKVEYSSFLDEHEYGDMKDGSVVRVSLIYSIDEYCYTNASFCSELIKK